jgi:uncharacterized membrane protein YesL
MRFSIINILWLIFNFPIIFLVTMMMFTSQRDEFITLLIYFTLLLPLIFFPATTAMFASVRQWVLHGTISPLFRTFYRYYKENFKKSFLGGLLLTGAWGIVVADYYYFMNKNSLFLYVIIIIGLLLFIFTMNFFSVVSHYDLNLSKLFKNTLFITIGNPLLSLLIIIGSSVIIYLSFFVFLFLIPLFLGTLIAYLSFLPFHRMYLTSIESTIVEN